MANNIRTYVLLAGMLVAICGLETTSQAQVIDVWGYCDFWDGGDSIFGGCDGYDNSSGCVHWDYLNAGNLWSPTRNSPFGGSGWNGGSSMSLADDFGDWGIDIEFGVRCSCINDEFFAFPVQAVQNVQPWPIPSGEVTDPCGDTWPAQTAANWCMALIGAGHNFEGRYVQEFPSGTGVDTCNQAVPNSAIPPFVSVSGGPPGGWYVGAFNGCAADTVGWGPTAVNYYRGYGVAPCGAVFNQSMRINQRGGAWVEYVVNTLGGTIGTSTVQSSRAGHTVQRVWP
jgi:hypothetical protein